jgi:hypothetical protein
MENYEISVKYELLLILLGNVILNKLIQITILILIKSFEICKSSNLILFIAESILHHGIKCN